MFGFIINSKKFIWQRILNLRYAVKTQRKRSFFEKMIRSGSFIRMCKANDLDSDAKIRLKALQKQNERYDVLNTYQGTELSIQKNSVGNWAVWMYFLLRSTWSLSIIRVVFHRKDGRSKHFLVTCKKLLGLWWDMLPHSGYSPDLRSFHERGITERWQRVFWQNREFIIDGSLLFIEASWFSENKMALWLWDNIILCQTPHDHITAKKVMPLAAYFSKIRP